MKVRIFIPIHPLEYVHVLVGLGIIPFLPTLFDEPVEHFVNKAFDQIERNILGKSIPERTDVQPRSDL